MVRFLHCLLFEFQGDNTTKFYVATTHLKAGLDEDCVNQRCNDVCTLHRALCDIDTKFPIILTGDMNDELESKAIKLIDGKQQSMNFRSVFEMTGFTTSKIRLDPTTSTMREVRRLIDYIFVRSVDVMHLTQAWRGNSCVSDLPARRYPSKQMPSDHVPLIAKFEFLENED